MHLTFSNTVDGYAADTAEMFAWALSRINLQVRVRISVSIVYRIATGYGDLYTSVSYDIKDMQSIGDELNRSVITDGYERVSYVNISDVINVYTKLKPEKRDGSLGLTTDHFINACFQLATHVVLLLLFSAMLIHGVTSDYIIVH